MTCWNTKPSWTARWDWSRNSPTAALPAAQEINLLLFADIKARFDRYIFPLIQAQKPVAEVMQQTHEVIVEHAMKLLNDNGEHDVDLCYTSDHIYGMIYYLTGLCHLNWKDYDNL